MNKDISKIALDQIKKTGMEPVSRTIFNLKRVTFWTLVVFSMLVGSISFAIILSILVNNDWELYNRFGLNFILNTLPYYWLLCLVIFAVLAEFYYRKTFFGYRHTILSIIGFYITITIAMGGIFQLLGVGNHMEQYLFNNVRAYHNLRLNNAKFWVNPDDGLLVGEIIEVNNDRLRITDFSNRIWIINIPEFNEINTQQVQVGQIIKIIGDREDENVFSAEIIKPFVPYRQNRHNGVFVNTVR